MKQSSPPTESNAVNSINDNYIETIFVEKITNVGVGFHVSKLTLSQETSNGTDKPFANIVIPTQRLFEFINFMSENILKNKDLRQSLVSSLDDFRNELTK